MAVNTDDPAGLISKTVKIHSIASKPELNGQLGMVVSYIHQQGRYVVQLQPSNPVGPQAPRTISLKDSNLAPASYLQRTQHTIAEMKNAANTLYNDPQTRAKVRQVYGEAQRRLPPGVKLEYAAAGIALSLFAVVWLVGFTRCMFIGSIIGIVGAVALPDILAGVGPKVIARNFPSRWRQMLVESTGLGWITERMAMGGLVFLLLMSARGLMAGVSKPQPPQSRTPFNAPVGGGLSSESVGKWTMEEIYKMGFDDSTQGKRYLQSLPVDHDSIGHFVSKSRSTMADEEDMDWADYEAANPPPPQKKGGFGIGTVMSLFAIGRVVKDMGFSADGNFDVNLLVANVKMMDTWKLGLLGMAIYRVVSSFL